MPSFAIQDTTSSCVKICSHSLSSVSEASLNSDALSEIISCGLLYLERNLLNPSMNCSVNMICISLRGTALVTKHVNKHTNTFGFSVLVLMHKGPK